MIVRESINFERGLDPKVSMDIGLSHFPTEIQSLMVKGKSRVTKKPALFHVSEEAGKKILQAFANGEKRIEGTWISQIKYDDIDGNRGFLIDLKGKWISYLGKKYLIPQSK